MYDYFGEKVFTSDLCNADVELGDLLIHAGPAADALKNATRAVSYTHLDVYKRQGIDDVEKAMEPMFSTGDSEERSGRGFTVMESFTDRLKVMSEKGKGTTVIMTKYLDIVRGI